MSEGHTHISKREQCIANHIGNVFLPAGSCAAVCGYVISFSESVGGLLLHEMCKEKGTHLYRRWLWDSGLEIGSEYCFKMLQVKVWACDLRTFLVRERNQETPKHKDSFVNSEFMDMPSVLRCQSFALSPPKSSAHSGDKEADTDPTSPGICMAWYLPAFPATLATILLCPALATHTFQPLIILTLSWLRAFACTFPSVLNFPYSLPTSPVKCLLILYVSNLNIS